MFTLGYKLRALAVLELLASTQVDGDENASNAHAMLEERKFT